MDRKKTRTTRSGKTVEVTRSKQRRSNKAEGDKSRTKTRKVTQADGSFVTTTKKKSSGTYGNGVGNRYRSVESSTTTSMPQPNTTRYTSTKRTKVKTPNSVIRRKTVNGAVVRDKTRGRKKK